MHSESLLDNLIEFYDKCASSGAVKLIRDPNKSLIQITAPPRNFRYFMKPLPMYIGKICFIFPKKSIKVHTKLSELRTLRDESYISISYLRKGKVIKVVCTDIDGKSIKKYKFKVATINL